MDRIYDILLVALLAILMICLQIIVESSMMMRYYKFWEENFLSLRPEWTEYFEWSIQVANTKIDNYTPRDWRMYNEGKDVGYIDGFIKGCLKATITAGMKQKNIIRKYLKEGLEKLSRDRKK